MNSRKRIIIVFTFLLLSVMLLGACGIDIGQTYPPKASLGSGQVFLFHPYTNKLGIYDLQLKKWNEVDAQGAFFQSFDWGNVYPYYVVGDQDTHKFYAGKIDEFSLKFNYSLEDKGAALAPFATDGKSFLYLREQMHDKPCVKRVITISDKGKVELVANLDGMGIMGGVIAGDYLYFICPSEGTDLYEVWSLDLSKDTQVQKPVLVRNDYNYYRLYQYRGQLLYIDKEKKLLYNDEITIKMSQKADLVFIDDEANILVEEYVNKDNNLEMVFTDISTGTVLETYVDAINFSRSDSEITIYGNGFIEHLNLPKGD